MKQLGSKVLRIAKVMLAGVVVIWLVVVVSKGVAKNYLSQTTETPHFTILWGEEEAEFFQCLPRAVEDTYERIASDLQYGGGEKITIKVFANPWVYNLSIGNPFPWPRLRATGNADYKSRAIDMLMPPPGDPVYTDKDLMELFCGTGVGHEVTHMLVSSINPAFIRGWWHEGIAQYEDYLPLKDRAEFAEHMERILKEVRGVVATGKVPTFNELASRNFNTFVAMKGYELSYTFVEYAVERAGAGALRSMVEHPYDYGRVFQATEEEVWQQWVEYLNKNYSSGQEIESGVE